VKGNGITMNPGVRRPIPRSPIPLIVPGLLLAVLLVACASPGASEPALPGGSGQGSADASPASEPSASAAFPVTITDDTGTSLTLAEEPAAIVSLAPSNTEIVCALDACDRLVGVTDFDDYPPEVADVPDVVIAAQVDVEAVVAAEPDLVLAAGNELTPSAVITQLVDLGLPVLTLYPESLDEVYADIELVGAALGRGDESATLVAEMEERAAAVEEAVATLDAPRTFYEVGVFEGTIYTAGEGSFLASLIELAGGDPITGDAGGSISLEELVAADPELILLGDATYDPTITADSVAARPGWAQMMAVHDGNVVPFAEDIVATRPGPRIIDGLEALARAIHPEAFD
jgi:iron complex transport system substrate-binding protein